MRLGARLFLLVVVSSLLPASLVLLAGWLQLRQQIRLWTIPSVEAALDASLTTNRRAFDRLQRHLEAEGRVLAESRLFPRTEADTVGLSELLDAGCRQFGIDLAQVYGWRGDRFELQVSRTATGATGPNASASLAVPHASAAGPQRPSPLRLSDEGGDVLAVPTFLWEQADRSETPRLRGALVLGIALGPRYYAQLGEVTTGLSFYRRLQEVGLVLRTGYGILALFILLLSLSLSLWIAGRVAGSVSRPVEDLVRGMEEVGRELPAGDTDRSGDDSAAGNSRIPEMARLAGAFFSMRATLRAYEERLREAERVKGAQETARFVAHEIRNTLTPVRAALSVLARQFDGMEEGSRDKGRRALDLIRNEADRMATLAGAFSEYAQFPERKTTRLDLAGLVETLARQEVPEQITLQVDRPAGLPEVEADRDEVERVFRNLIKNAVEATPTDGTISLVLSTVAGRSLLKIELSDTGCGMNEETLRKAFQPGFSTKETGSGLGLALVRRSLSHYGGSIRVDSAPGQGTRFKIEFPAAAGTESGGTADHG
jgi:signal transduction histidine kinase